MNQGLFKEERGPTSLSAQLQAVLHPPSSTRDHQGGAGQCAPSGPGGARSSHCEDAQHGPLPIPSSQGAGCACPLTPFHQGPSSRPRGATSSLAALVEVGVLLHQGQHPFLTLNSWPNCMANFSKAFLKSKYMSVIFKIRMHFPTGRGAFRKDGVAASSPALSSRHRLSRSSVPPAA